MVEGLEDTDGENHTFASQLSNDFRTIGSHDATRGPFYFFCMSFNLYISEVVNLTKFSSKQKILEQKQHTQD